MSEDPMQLLAAAAAADGEQGVSSSSSNRATGGNKNDDDDDDELTEEEEDETVTTATTTTSTRKQQANGSGGGGKQSTSKERGKARKARKELERRASRSLSERQRKARRVERDEKKESGKTKADSGGRKRATESSAEEAERERKRRKEARIAEQNRLAAAEREKRKKREAAKLEMQRKEAELIAEARKADKERKLEKKKQQAAAKRAQKTEVVVQIMTTSDGAGATDSSTPGSATAKCTAAKVAGAVTDNDVLLGRGGVTNAHEGNKRFRKIVMSFQPRYVALQSRPQKSEMSRSVVEQVKSAGGRFLKEVDGEWIVVGDNIAVKKASQALRENAKELKQLCASAANAITQEGHSTEDTKRGSQSQCEV